MANEIRGASTSGTLYARIINAAGLWWNGSGFEAYAAANYGNYDVAMTEQGDSGVYVADFPAALTISGTYEYFVHRQLGVSPAEGDPVINTGKVDWTGTTSITAATGAMSGSDWRDYVLRKGFKRPDKDTELFEATTDAIQEMRRRFMFDEAEVDATTTDVISVLGDFKIAIEADMGLLLDVILQDDDTGTKLEKVSKARFDELYPSINVESDHGYPRHYCVYAGQIYVGPIPDRVTYSYRLSYSRRAGAVVSSTPGVPFTNLYRDVLCSLVLHLLYEAMDEFEKAGYYSGKFESALLPVQRRENINNGESSFNMEPVGF